MSKKLIDELKAVRGKRNCFGSNDVVEWARKHPDGAIYQEFDRRNLWDDAAAAEKAREQFARYLIKTYRIKIKRDGDGKPVSVPYFVSTGKNRSANPGRGYEERSSVLSIPVRKRELAEDFARDLESVSRRYVDAYPSESSEVNAIARRLRGESGGMGPLRKAAAPV